MKFAAGDHIVSEDIILTGNSIVEGEGALASRLILQNNASIKIFVDEHQQAQIKDIGIVSSGTEFPIQVHSNVNPGAINSNLQIDRIEVTGQFTDAILLDNIHNPRLRDIRIAGERNLSCRSAIHITTTKSACEHFISGLQCYFVNDSVLIDGNPEGIYINQSAIVACRRGVVWTGGETKPLLNVSGCHINTSQRGIMMGNILQYQIIGNLFYHQKWDNLEDKDYIGVESLAKGNNHGTIVGNTFCGMVREGVAVSVPNGLCAQIVGNTVYNLDRCYDGSPNNEPIGNSAGDCNTGWPVKKKSFWQRIFGK